jgi:hypothetical protein
VWQEILVEDKTLATTVTLGEKFIGHDVNSAGIAVAREKFVPRAKSMKGSVVAVGNSLVEFLRVIDGRKNCTIANNDLFASNVGLVEVLARKRTRRGGQEKN